MIVSPCINICALDCVTGYCTGCGRTMDEIGAWRDASDAQRAAIVALLPSRLAVLQPSPSTSCEG